MPKVLKSTCSILSCLSACKISFSLITYFLRYCKQVANLLFWVISAYLATHTPKMIRSIWRNLWSLSAGNKSTSSFTFSLRHCKDIANLLFWVFWACLITQTTNDSINLWKTSMFISCQKSTSSFTSFLRYYILKNPAIWLADSILAHNSRTRSLPDMRLVLKYQ